MGAAKRRPYITPVEGLQSPIVIVLFVFFPAFLGIFQWFPGFVQRRRPRMCRFSFVPLIVLLTFPLHAQPFPPTPNPLYDDTVIPSVHISIDPDSLAAMYNPDSLESDYEYPANFVFDNGVARDSLGMIGMRLRGNTSRFAAKKSFKVSFNTFVPGRKFHGIEKLNLNGEHNDPSVIRAKLCWDLFARAGVPAPRANHMRVFINGTYYGLYINVEHVDENFVLSRFGNNGGNLYKCLWPADLTYRGSDPNLYKFESGGRRTYELKINEEIDDYTDLANLIATVNLAPDSSFAVALQRRFNVNGFLRALAVDVATGSWDDYWFLKNNYYLYDNTATGKFDFIPYDYDNTFGIWWDGILSGVDWGTRSPYTWGHPSESRPLATRILGNQVFRDRFSFYLNRLIQRHFNPAPLFPRIDSIHAQITTAAEQDLYRTYDYGFSIQAFHDSYSQALGGHVVYGLKPYISARRTSALGQLQLHNIAPIISDVVALPSHPVPGSQVAITCRVEDDDPAPEVYVHHQVNGVWRALIPMFDDGLHQDGAAGDEVYGAFCGPFSAGDQVDYYIRSLDAGSRLSVEPPDAPTSLYGLPLQAHSLPLFVNEFMAKNDSTVTDPFGEYEDWIELFNAGTEPVWLGNLYLTDNLSNPTKWAFPDTTLPGGAFLVVWADEDGVQGSLHANFKLSRDGEQIGIFRSDSSGTTPVDTFSFGYQQGEISMGRYPDGGWQWESMSTPTPNARNLVDRSCPVTAGWNLVSVPLSVADYRASVLYPSASSSAYQYDPIAHYVACDTLENRRGYWLKFDSAATVRITGIPRERDTVAVTSGWNLIGTIASPVETASILQTPPDIILSPFYAFTGSYAIVNALSPGGAYWLKCSGPGTLVLGAARQLRKLPAPKDGKDQLSTIRNQR
jgi:hypothetical protein